MSIAQRQDLIPDVDAIKRLGAKRVAEDLGAIHRDGVRGNVGRWCWQGGDDAYLQFFPDGSYRDHKRGIGGSAIDFVIQSRDPNRAHDQAHFRAAVADLAERYSLHRDYRSAKKKARDAARSAAQIVAGNSTETREFMELMGMHRATLSVTPTSGVAWSPCVPWQGIASRTKGWTAAAARAHMGDADALRVFVLDVDGAKLGDDNTAYPRADEIEHLCGELASKGIAPRALVVSSWRGGARAKFHIYFVADERLTDHTAYEAMHHSLVARVQAIVSRWSWLGDDDKRAIYTVDEASAKIAGLVRVPGSSKPNGDAACVLKAWPGATMAVAELALSDEKFTVRSDIMTTVYEYGTSCRRTVTKFDATSGKEEIATHWSGVQIYPVARSENLDTGQHGILYRYRSNGETRSAEMPSGATVEKNAAKRAASAAADDGVQVAARSAHELAFHLGAWAQQPGRRTVYTTASPGWHRDGKVYVGGRWALGGDVEIIDSPAIARRNARRGSAAEWAAGVREVVTPAILCALGQSFAGPLVRMLDSDPWILHIHGPSSSGKSSAAALAQSVWRDPATMPRWNTTQNGLEALAQGADGSCLVLDELHQFRGRRDQLGQVVHDLCAPVGRIRLRKTGAMIAPRSWSISVLSTGEVMIAQKLGDDQQGGHAVRCLDFGAPMTLSAEHSDAIYSVAGRCYGTAGEAFVRHVFGLDRAELRAAHGVILDAISERCGGMSPEAGRVARRIATMLLALELARDAEVLDFGDDMIDSAEELLVGEIIVRRKDTPTCPEERAWAALQSMMTSHPARFPQIGSEPRAQIVGWLSETGGHIYTCGEMIDAAGIEICTRAGITPRRFTDWMRAQNHASPPADRRRIAGSCRRWVQVWIDA
jgi:hypothetical protein